MTYTVLGATGLIGSAMLTHLSRQECPVFAPTRTDDFRDRPLGHVIYAIGITSDFRTRPFETVRAHVSVLNELLEHSDFTSFTYLSSTRVYANSPSASEASTIHVNPTNPSDLYNLSKLMGESLVLHSGRPQVRVARLSNVVTPNKGMSSNFVDMLIEAALVQKHINLLSSMDSEKDYIHIEDVVGLLLRIATAGKEKIYNVASGQNIPNRSWTRGLQELTHCSVSVDADSPKICFPSIDIRRIQGEFGFVPRSPLEILKPRTTSPAFTNTK